MGLLTEEVAEVFLEMTDRRNDTPHTYKEEVAQVIYGRVKEYVVMMRSLVDALVPGINP